MYSKFLLTLAVVASTATARTIPATPGSPGAPFGHRSTSVGKFPEGLEAFGQKTYVHLDKTVPSNEFLYPLQLDAYVSLNYLLNMAEKAKGRQLTGAEIAEILQSTDDATEAMADDKADLIDYANKHAIKYLPYLKHEENAKLTGDAKPKDNDKPILPVKRAAPRPRPQHKKPDQGVPS